MFLCLVHNPHPSWSQQLSSWFLSQILFLSPSPGYVLCFLCLSHSNARSAWCDARLECETHSVWLRDKKVLDFYREFSALLLSLCFLPGKKGLKFGRDPGITPAWRSKAEFCSLCFPILFSGLLCSRLPFPWIWLPSGQAFYSLLHHGITSVSVPSMTLQQITSLSQWDPVCCSPLPPYCVQGCYFRTLNVKNFWDYLVIGNKIVINAT